MSVEEIIARAFQVLVAMTGAYLVALWFALVVWTFRDIESRSRSVVAQIFSTLVVVLFFLPGVLIYLILRPKETLDEAFGRSLEEEYLLQDLEDLSLCPTCHRPVRDEFVVCPACYTELRRACPSCARLVDLNWALCPYCTTELAPPALEEGEEAQLEERRPSFLPRPLRLLHERTEVRVEHSMGLVSPDEAPQLPDGEPGSLVARETQQAGAWVDDSGKRAWILTRAREVFRPLLGAEPVEPPHPNGADRAADPEERGHAPNGHRPGALFAPSADDGDAAALPLDEQPTQEIPHSPAGRREPSGGEPAVRVTTVGPEPEDAGVAPPREPTQRKP